MAIKILTNDGATVILTFDYYKKDFYSLKQVTRTSRKSGKIKRFHMNFIYLIAAILKKKEICELLFSEDTKQSISDYLIRTTELWKRQTRYLISANGKTQFCNGQGIVLIQVQWTNLVGNWSKNGQRW